MQKRQSFELQHYIRERNFIDCEDNDCSPTQTSERFYHKKSPEYLEDILEGLSNVTTALCFSFLPHTACLREWREIMVASHRLIIRTLFV